MPVFSPQVIKRLITGATKISGVSPIKEITPVAIPVICSGTPASPRIDQYVDLITFIGAEERIEFEYQGTIYVGKTEDLSEKGIAWSGECGGQQRLPKPGERMEVVIVTEHYRAKLRVEIVYVSHTEEGTRFAASAEPVSEPDMRNWLQIIHDRAHSLPKEIDPWRTVYDDIVRNVHMRRQGWRKNKIS